MKRLLIHIGTGKTGTSSIQNFLFANRNQLAHRFSVFYPEYGLSKMAHFGEVIHAHYPIVSWAVDRKAEKIQKLSTILNQSAYQTTIISCEAFYHQFSAEDIAYFANIFKDFTIEIICYVRRQDLFIESAWKQKIKTGASKAEFSHVLQKHTQTENLEKSHANYYKMLKPWAKIFGLEQIKIKIFDKSEWTNVDLLDDFLNTCAINVEEAQLALIKQKYTNIAFPSELIGLVQKVNSMRLLEKADQQSFVLYLNQLNCFKDTPLLSQADRLAIIKNYQPSNKMLFAEFNQRPIPKCFLPVSIKKSAHEKNIDEILLENIATKSIVAAWKQSHPNIYSQKISLKQVIKLIYKKLKMFYKNVSV